MSFPKISIVHYVTYNSRIKTSAGMIHNNKLVERNIHQIERTPEFHLKPKKISIIFELFARENDASNLIDFSVFLHTPFRLQQAKSMFEKHGYYRCFLN